MAPSLGRPAPSITARFDPAPPSRDRVHDHSVRIGTWAVAVARATVRGGSDGYRGRSDDRHSGRSDDSSSGRSRDWLNGRSGYRRSRFNRRSGLVSRGRSSDIGASSSASGNSDRSTSCYCAAIVAPMDSAVNPQQRSRA